MEPHEEKIAELRGQIDEIDRQLVELFERRMDASREIGALKREHNLGIRNERRELEVKANCRAYCKNDRYTDYAQSMMKCIMGACRGIQRADDPDYDDPWQYAYKDLDVAKELGLK